MSAGNNYGRKVILYKYQRKIFLKIYTPCLLAYPEIGLFNFALLIPALPIVYSCNFFATLIAAVVKYFFLPLPRLKANEPDSSNLAIIFGRLFVVTEHDFIDFDVRSCKCRFI